MVSKTKISFALLRTSILCIPGVIDSYAAQNFRGLDRSCGRRKEAVNLTHLFLSLFFCFLMLTVFYFTSSSDVCIHNFIDRFNQYEISAAKVGEHFLHDQKSIPYNFNSSLLLSKHDERIHFCT